MTLRMTGKVCWQNDCPTRAFASSKWCPHLLQESCYKCHCDLTITLCGFFSVEKLCCFEEHWIQYISADGKTVLQLLKKPQA